MMWHARRNLPCAAGRQSPRLVLVIGIPERADALEGASAVRQHVGVHAHLLSERLASVAQAGGVQTELAAGFNTGRHVGQHERDALELMNRPEGVRDDVRMRWRALPLIGGMQ